MALGEGAVTSRIVKRTKRLSDGTVKKYQYTRAKKLRKNILFEFSNDEEKVPFEEKLSSAKRRLKLEKNTQVVYRLLGLLNGEKSVTPGESSLPTTSSTLPSSDCASLQVKPEENTLATSSSTDVAVSNVASMKHTSVQDKMAEDIVHLNVGGVQYTTTKSTLCQYPNSMLGAMFNGSMPTTKDEHGRYFIDRDGSLFNYVLNFLRSSQLALPEDFKYYDLLALEADFFQIEPLVHALNEIKRNRVERSFPQGQLLEIIEVRTGSTATMPTNNSRVKTIIHGRKDVISSLPSYFFGPVDKIQHVNESAFIELELVGSSSRLKLGTYLQNHRWLLTHSDISSSSGYDSKSMISTLIIEQSYRDRWFLRDSNVEKKLATVNSVIDSESKPDIKDVLLHQTMHE